LPHTSQSDAAFLPHQLVSCGIFTALNDLLNVSFNCHLFRSIVSFNFPDAISMPSLIFQRLTLLARTMQRTFGMNDFFPASGSGGNAPRGNANGYYINRLLQALQAVTMPGKYIIPRQ